MEESQFEKIEDNAEKLYETIQNDLACMDAEAPKVSDEELTEWKLKYSTKFHELMEKRPDILSLYATDRKKALDEIDRELYSESE